MRKAVLLLVSSALCNAFNFELCRVDVKNYTSAYSYKILKSFNGNGSLPNPVEGYVHVYRGENISALAPPPFMPGFTWMAFVPSTLGYLSKPQVDAIGSAGYSLLLVDGALQIDGDVMKKNGNFSLVIVNNATNFFAALPTNSTSVRVSVYPSAWIGFGSPDPMCLCLGPGPFLIMILASLCTCCCCFCWYKRIARRYVRVSEVDGVQSRSALELEERNSRQRAAKMLDKMPLVLPVWESGEIEQGRTCCVCLCSIDNLTECKSLPCSHCFHPACIDEWLVEYKFSCPVCRQDPLDKLA